MLHFRFSEAYKYWVRSWGLWGFDGNFTYGVWPERMRKGVLIVNIIILPRREISPSSKKSEVLNFMHGFLIIEITYSFSMMKPVSLFS